MKKLTVFITVIVVAIAVGFVFWQKNENKKQARAEAILQAQQYKAEGLICTQAITPAVHTATGAKFTFKNGCLAPGWVSERLAE